MHVNEIIIGNVYIANLALCSDKPRLRPIKILGKSKRSITAKAERGVKFRCRRDMVEVRAYYLSKDITSFTYEELHNNYLSEIFRREDCTFNSYRMWLYPSEVLDTWDMFMEEIKQDKLAKEQNAERVTYLDLLRLALFDYFDALGWDVNVGLNNSWDRLDVHLTVPKPRDERGNLVYPPFEWWGQYRQFKESEPFERFAERVRLLVMDTVNCDGAPYFKDKISPYDLKEIQERVDCIHADKNTQNVKDRMRAKRLGKQREARARAKLDKEMALEATAPGASSRS